MPTYLDAASPDLEKRRGTVLHAPLRRSVSTRDGFILACGREYRVPHKPKVNASSVRLPSVKGIPLVYISSERPGTACG